MVPPLDRAHQIAEDVFFPAALAVDAAPRVPAGHLDLLASEGFYGLAGPTEAGGLGVPDFAAACRVVEALAGGCLTTTFVWLQHQGAVLGVAGSQTPGLARSWLVPLCRGELRAGVAQAALRPGPASVRARRVEGGYRFDGTAAWVTGWGMVDVLHTAARDEQDTVIWALLDAEAGPTLWAEPLELVAANASRTVLLRIADHEVPDARVVSTGSFQGGQSVEPMALRINGSLALGVAGRCATLLGSSELVTDVDECRAALDAASADTMPAARAGASALAMRAATLLTVSTGARSLLRTEHAQRLVREAMFLLVFGSRPAIREALLARLAGDPVRPA